MIVGCYARVSTIEQAKEGYSIGEQQERLEKYCESMGWKIYNIYVDAGFSGASTDRPALQQMLLDIKFGRIQKVVVYRLDRLSRSQKDTLKLIEDDFLANNVDFVSMRENFDTSTPFGRAMIGILAVFAQLEREQIKERMEMGKDARAKLGKYMGGIHVPFGYDYEEGELKINDYEAMIIREMFRMVIEGHTVHSIIKTFNEKGYRTRETFWRDKTCRRMLSSEIYIGNIKYKQKWFKGNHDPIISIDDFEEVQRILDKRLDARKKQMGINPGKVNSYLGGILFCAHCGAHYTRNSQTCVSKGKKYTYHRYTCNSRYSHGRKELVHDPDCKNKTWREAELNELVFDQIKQLALEENHPKPDESKNENSIKILEDRIKELNSQILKLMDLYKLDSIPFELLQNKIKDIDEQKKQLEAQLLDLKNEDKKKLSMKETIKLARSFDEVLKNGSFDEIRHVITTLIEYIEIDGEDIAIHWNF